MKKAARGDLPARRFSCRIFIKNDSRYILVCEFDMIR